MQEQVHARDRRHTNEGTLLGFAPGSCNRLTDRGRGIRVTVTCGWSSEQQPVHSTVATHSRLERTDNAYLNALNNPGCLPTCLLEASRLQGSRTGGGKDAACAGPSSPSRTPC